jgi:hypothetical protein
MRDEEQRLTVLAWDWPAVHLGPGAACRGGMIEDPNHVDDLPRAERLAVIGA